MGSAGRGARAIQWIGYLSSTGIYGDHRGTWVDESTMPTPTSPRSERRAAAEASWLVLGREKDLPVHIFRLSGIYGPGRSVFDELRDGTAERIVKPDHLFGRIHVDDIATTLAASMMQPNPGAIYNVTDDEPAAPAEVMTFAAALMGMRPPREVPFEKAELSPMAATFWADNRRVSNVRIKRELGVKLAHPNSTRGAGGDPRRRTLDRRLAQQFVEGGRMRTRSAGSLRRWPAPLTRVTVTSSRPGAAAARAPSATARPGLRAHGSGAPGRRSRSGRAAPGDRAPRRAAAS